jgi:hypothetical protein
VVLPRPLTLPAEALARLVTIEKLGEPHVTLKPTAIWRLRRLEEQAEHTTLAGLATIGLFDDRGRVEVELAASLAVLCRPATEFYGWIHSGGRTVGVLAGAIGREAILAIRDGEQVSLRQIRPENLPDALVEQTAEVPPGHGDTISFLQSDALASVGGRRETEAGVGTRPASQQVRLAQRIAGQQAAGGGQLSVAVRDGLGRRLASDHPLRYADTPNGRWVNLMSPVPGGDNRILIAPAGNRDLVGRLREMHRALTR